MKTSELRKLIREEVCKLLAEATQQIPGKDGIIILVSDYAKKHIMEHNKPGMGSVFKSGITEDLIINMVKEVATKLSGDGGAYELNKPGIGYDLVLPIDKARALKDAKEGEVEKQEGPNKVKVPSISTSQPLSSFVSNRVSLVIRKSNPQFLPDDVKNDTTIAEKIKEGKCYSLLTAFPGNPDIPKASEWNGKFAVIVPDTKLGESKNMKTSEFRKLIREEVKKTLTEAVKLPKDFSIVHLDGKRYTLEYSKYDMEPTVAQAEQIVGLLRRQFAKIADTVQAGPIKGEATIYIRDENIAIGLLFTSKLGPDDMDEVAGGINYRN